MAYQRTSESHARIALGLVVTGVVVTLLWPVVAALVVFGSYDTQESCARVGGSGDAVRYDFFPPRMLCTAMGSSVGSHWVSATAVSVTVGFTVVLLLGVATMIAGIIVGLRAVPRVAPTASAANSAYEVGSLPSLAVRRLRELCGLLAVVSVLSPMWMFYVALGIGADGPGAPDPGLQVPVYRQQLLAAAVLPLLAIASGVIGWVLRARNRSGRADAASVAIAGLVAAFALLALTLALGLGTIAKTVAADGYVPAPASDDVQFVPRPDASFAPPRVEAPPAEPPTVPSTALTPTELEQQFAAFVAQTAERFGPAFAEPERQGAIPGPALDLAVAAEPYAFDCLGTGIGYGMELTFSGADADDWDVNYDAAAAAYLRITDGWAVDGYPSAPENSEYYVTADEPSVVSQLHARHIGSTVRVGMQSLCVAK